MWRASVLTIFPEMFPGPLALSLAGRALQSGIWSLDINDIRNAATDKHRTVDDTPAGGGPGMVMKADVLASALDNLALDGVPHDTRPRLLMSPRGKPLTQERVSELASGLGAVIVCARFEGVDERLISARKLEEVSLGDFILSGGEIAALALLDCMRAAAARRHGQGGLRGGRKLRRRPARIPAIHPAAGVRGRADPRGAAVRRPRQGGCLAAGRGRAPHPRTPPRPLGGLPRTEGGMSIP